MPEANTVPGCPKKRQPAFRKTRTQKGKERVMMYIKQGYDVLKISF